VLSAFKGMKKSHHATQSFKGIGASRARRAHILIVQPIAMLIFKGVKVKVKSSNKSLPSPPRPLIPAILKRSCDNLSPCSRAFR